MSPRRVTLLSDFGTVDGYAAAMAGVIAAAAPTAAIEHASHDVPPGDILTAALTLSRYAFLYPEGTVHLVVVDPGVGTDRRAISAAVEGRLFVAPDNGVLTRVVAGRESAVVELDPGRWPLALPASTSATFHGRDIFAPAAALLAGGAPVESLGPTVDDPLLLALPEPVRTSTGVAGEVIQVDRYGNLVTNIPHGLLGARRRWQLVDVEGRPVGPVLHTYGDVEPGELLALIGSLGLLEVSVRDGSAASRLGAGRGARVRVSEEPPAP